MEQAHTRKSHCHIMFIAGSDDILITIGTTRLKYVADAGLGGALDTIGEREEGVRTERDTAQVVEPGKALVSR